jgi:hypothetical protein
MVGPARRAAVSAVRAGMRSCSGRRSARSAGARASPRRATRSPVPSPARRASLSAGRSRRARRQARERVVSFHSPPSPNRLADHCSSGIGRCPWRFASCEYPAAPRHAVQGRHRREVVPCAGKPRGKRMCGRAERPLGLRRVQCGGRWRRLQRAAGRQRRALPQRQVCSPLVRRGLRCCARWALVHPEEHTLPSSA